MKKFLGILFLGFLFCSKGFSVEFLSDGKKIKTIIDLKPWLDIDSSGKTKTAHVYFDFKSEAYIEVSCYDWSDKLTEEKGYQDHLKVVLRSSDFGSLYLGDID